MKKIFFLTTLIVVILVFIPKQTYADNSDTIYNGVDYSAVYNKDYYLSHYGDLQSSIGNNPAALLSHFVNFGMNEGRQACVTFDVNYYKSAYGDLNAAYGTTLKSYYYHFIQFGYNEGRQATVDNIDYTAIYNGVDYSAVYNKNFYLSTYPDLRAAYGNNTTQLIVHFLNFGMAEGRQGCSTFNIAAYIANYPDLKAAYLTDLKSYYIHYLQFGKGEGRIATGPETSIDFSAIYNGVDYSAIYNKDYYLNTYSDVRAAYGNNPTALIQHFLNFGMAEGRQGCSTFNVAAYIANYPDLRAAYLTNIKGYYMHYLKYGAHEGRVAIGPETSIDFSAIYNGVDYSAIYNKDYYLNTYSDVRAAYGNNPTALIQHFLNFGMAEGRQACSTFNVASYFNNYPDLRAIFKFNIKSYYFHYLNYGIKEGRIANGSEIWRTVGIDVSEHNGKINWESVKNDGIGFAMIRIGYGEDVTNQDDGQAIYNITECERLGIPYGVYLYSYALSLQDIDSEVRHIIRQLNGRNPAMGVYLDMEDADSYKVNHKLNPYTNGNLLTQMCINYMAAMKSKGYSIVGTYANCDYFTNILNYNTIKAYGEVWLAHWNVSSPSYPCLIWQYSNSGSISGINGRVDMNLIIGN